MKAATKKPAPFPVEVARLVDAAWHALDFLPEGSPSANPGSVTDPKGDLRRALEALQEVMP